MTEENGTKIKKPIWKRWWFWVLAVFIIIIIASGGENGNSPSSAPNQDKPAAKEASATTSQPAPAKKDDLSLESYEWEAGEFGIRYIVGVIKNNTNKKYTYVQVEINLYDEGGAQVGSTLDNLNNLEPGGVWKFKAVVMEDEATKAKVAGITGW